MDSHSSTVVDVVDVVDVVEVVWLLRVWGLRVQRMSTVQLPQIGALVLVPAGYTSASSRSFVANYVGVVRFCGKRGNTDEVVVGVELDEPVGHCNGKLDGRVLFSVTPPTCEEDEEGSVVSGLSGEENRDRVGGEGDRDEEEEEELKYGLFVPLAGVTVISARVPIPPSGTLLPQETLEVHRAEKGPARRHLGRPIHWEREGEQHDVAVGERVISKGRKGVVQYVGPVSFASGVWYGVELDKAVGRHDGSVEGVFYFNCLPNHGVFVRRKAVFEEFKARKLKKIHTLVLSLLGHLSQTPEERGIARKLTPQHFTDRVLVDYERFARKIAREYKLHSLNIPLR